MMYIVIALMLATLLVLVSGVVLMGTGGEMNKKYGNKLMTLRVGLQGATLAAVVLMFMTR